MASEQSELKYLDGCKKCKKKCQFNQPVAGPSAIQSTSLYGCNSIHIQIAALHKFIERMLERRVER